MIEIAGGIILAIIGIICIIAAIVWWPVTVAIVAFGALMAWLSAHGWIR